MLNGAVGEHIPVKQGLRLIAILRAAEYLDRRRAYSSKTRIKTLYSFCFIFFVYVGEHIPVKQGLRLALVFALAQLVAVGEHIPVKQGLRRIDHFFPPTSTA